MTDAPKLVIHTLCGEPVFYYFGDAKDAQQLKNFDDITTLEGNSIVPQDIMKCPNCQERIRIEQINVAVQDTNTVTNYKLKLKYDLVTKIAVEEMRRKEYEKAKEEFNKSTNFLWNTDDDTDRIRKEKPK